MRGARAGRPAASLLVAALVLTGCSSSAGDDGDASPDPARADPVPGAVLRPDAAALSPDGSRLAVPCGDALCVWSTDDGTLADTWEGGTAVAWSPAGDLVATTEVDDGRASVLLLDADSGQRVRTLEGPEVEEVTDVGGQGLADLAFTPDGTTVLAAAPDGTVGVWTVEGEEVATLDAASPMPDAVAVDPEGRLVAVAGTDAPVEVWDLEEREVVGTVGDEPQGDVAWSPDGTVLATATRAADDAARVRTWDARTWSELGSRPGQGDQLAFSPDGTVLALSLKDRAEVELWAPDGGGVQTLRAGSTPPRAVLWSPDGGTLHAVAADAVLTWDLDSGQRREVLPPG